MTDHSFQGRSALVTGAASGIGAACARWLDRQGAAKLWLIDRDGDRLADHGLSCQVEAVIGDIADEAFWSDLEPRLAGLDHAVLNAGIGVGGAIADHTFEEWRRGMAVNLDGAFLSLRAALRAMKAKDAQARNAREIRRGSVVLTASITGVKPVPGIGSYGVAKAGVAHMARIAAAEVSGEGIRVNAVAPGGVDTAIWDSSANFREGVAAHGRKATLAAMAATTPRGRFATPDEIAGEIGFLLSDQAGNITGTVLVTDGGYSL
ncbi:MAG: SDR family oxidoreductase [Erythrobacter sp.]|nr:SDR family oxidoreductase [Erythrobacter sp.]